MNENSEGFLQSERIRAIGYAVAAALYAWFALSFGADFLFKILSDIGLDSVLTFIVGLHIGFGIFGLLVICAIKRTTLRKLLFVGPKEFIGRLFVLVWMIFGWYCILDGFGIGLWNLLLILQI